MDDSRGADFKDFKYTSKFGAWPPGEAMADLLDRGERMASSLSD
jgi:hypothetical protein